MNKKVLSEKEAKYARINYWWWRVSGRKLAAALAAKGEIQGRAITHLTQADLVAPDPVTAGFPTEGAALDIADRAAVDAAFATPPDAIFHLAAVVSGQAEAEFDIGMRVNLMGTINLLEAARAAGHCPLVVFTSSVAAYGGEIPEMIEDWTALNPQTSYGAQKVMGEMLLTDMSRKGFIDGRGLRLPTVTVRPGKPNAAAASSFMSSIFREPLQGETANCPVAEDYPIWSSAPRTVVANLVHAAEVPAADWGENRCLAIPGLTATVREMIDAMTAVAATRARIVMVAIHAAKPSVDMFQFFWRELQLVGVRVYEPEDYDKAIELVARGAIDGDTVITDVSPLEDIQKAFEALDSNPTALKSLIKVGDLA